MRWRRTAKPKNVTSFTIRPGLLSGKPVVILDFGKVGQSVMNADDLEGLIAELERNLRAARELGET